MELFAVKLGAIAVIFAVAIMGAYAATRTSSARNAERIFALGSLFGGGVFLGAGLIHMLPDSVAQLSAIFPDLDYPVPYALAALGLIAILAVDRLGHHISARRRAAQAPGDASGTATTMILLLVLSFHSIIAGAAAGTEESAANSVVLLLAILAHKGSAAFALTTGLLRSAPDRSIWPHILLFACMTPIGIALGATLRHLIAADSAHVFEGVFDALAAATFVYVATLEVIGPEFRSHDHTASKLVALTAGLAVMALVALWL